MSKKNNQHLLVPGASGWELWSGNQCTETYEVERASELPKPPPAPFVFAFSVKEATALPFVAPTTDEELLVELSEMHYERLGVMPNPGAGKLSDHYIISRGEESSRVLAVVLRLQTERDMPRRSPANFELSARLFRPQGQVVAVWMEFGSWVFAVYDEGEVVYFQALKEARLGASVARELQLAQAQLQMQGLINDDFRVVLWDTKVPASEFEQALGMPVSQEPKPAPTLPAQLGGLLPADVAAERRESRKRLQMIAAGVVLLLALIGGILFVGKDYLKDRETLAQLKEDVAETQADASDAKELLAKADELQPLIDNDMWPQQLLLECAMCLPAGRKVRFSEFSVFSDDKGLPSQIEIKGQAQDTNRSAIGSFQTLLERNRSLRDAYTFETPTSEQNSRKMWEFTWLLNLKTSEKTDS